MCKASTGTGGRARDGLLPALGLYGFVALGLAFTHYGFRPRLAEAFYTDGIVITDALRIGKRSVVVLGLLVAVAGFAAAFRPVRVGLSGIERMLLAATVIMSAWAVGLMDYNHYYDHWFAVDRGLVLLLAALSLRYPLLLPLFVLQLSLLNGQLSFPAFIGYDHTHKSMVIPLLWGAWLTCLYRRLSGTAGVRQGYVLLFLALAGIWYLRAGWGKWQLDWVTDNNLYYLTGAAIHRGFDNGLPHSWVVAVAEWVRNYPVLPQIATLVVEAVGPLVLLADRRLGRVVLLSFIGLHVGIYLLSGVFFWQWIVLESILLASSYVRPAAWGALFSIPARVFYFALLFSLPFLIKVGKLAWMDCGYTNDFHFTLVWPDHRTEALAASFFSPYDTGFAKNRFYFLASEANKATTLGQCTDADLRRNVYAARGTTGFAGRALATSDTGTTPREVSREVEDIRSRFYGFCRQFVVNKLRYDPRWISCLDPPVHMQLGPNQQNIDWPSETPDYLATEYRHSVVLPQLRVSVISSDTTLTKISDE